VGGVRAFSLTLNEMTIFIAAPWLALVPGALFFVLFRLTRRKRVGSVALAWCLYALYEYGMSRRWLCSGECNIRVDLLLVYPTLAVASLAGLIVAWRALRRRRARQPG
jgi:hypothetical protein